MLLLFSEFSVKSCHIAFIFPLKCYHKFQVFPPFFPYVGEHSGTGLCDVYHVWKENGLKEPELIETIDPDRITLTLQTEIDGNLDGNDGNPDGNDGNFSDNLSRNERLVLQTLSTNPELSAAKIGLQIGISKSSVERGLRSLKKKNNYQTRIHSRKMDYSAKNT